MKGTSGGLEHDLLLKAGLLSKLGQVAQGLVQSHLLLSSQGEQHNTENLQASMKGWKWVKTGSPKGQGSGKAELAVSDAEQEWVTSLRESFWGGCYLGQPGSYSIKTALCEFAFLPHNIISCTGLYTM